MASEVLRFDIANNDNDWLHQVFLDLFEKYARFHDSTDPRQGVNREHHLYGPVGTRLGWIFCPQDRYIIKPQCLLMPECDDSLFSLDDPDTSMTSTTAHAGDTSTDSMGAIVISQSWDIKCRRGRQEVDFVVTKVRGSAPQTVVLVVELKRDNVEPHTAAKQLKEYMRRLAHRRTMLNHGEELKGLLVLGQACELYAIKPGDPKFKVHGPESNQLLTDGTEINLILLELSGQCNLLLP